MLQGRRVSAVSWGWATEAPGTSSQSCSAPRMWVDIHHLLSTSWMMCNVCAASKAPELTPPRIQRVEFTVQADTCRDCRRCRRFLCCQLLWQLSRHYPHPMSWLTVVWPLSTKRTLQLVFPGVLVQINKMQEMQRYCNLCTLLKLQLLHKKEVPEINIFF